jgi:hypothetical protein
MLYYSPVGRSRGQGGYHVGWEGGEDIDMGGGGGGASTSTSSRMNITTGTGGLDHEYSASHTPHPITSSTAVPPDGQGYGMAAGEERRAPGGPFSRLENSQDHYNQHAALDNDLYGGGGGGSMGSLVPTSLVRDYDCDCTYTYTIMIPVPSTRP